RPLLSSDRIRKLRAGVALYAHAGPEAYGDVESRAVYADLAQRAGALVREQGGAIVDATFRRAADADAFTLAAREHATWVVREDVPAVRLERAAALAQAGSISDAGPAIVAREQAIFHGPFEPPGPALARLDTTLPVPLLLEQLAAALDTRLADHGLRWT